jgi:four helix bundle protein
MPKPTFAHHRLEAYRAALDLAEAGHRLAGRIPRGFRWLADHLARAACAAPVLTAEGANRVSPGHKRQRFAEALGECGEAAAVAEVVERLALVRGEEPAAVLAHADRTAALLTGLVRKYA